MWGKHRCRITKEIAIYPPYPDHYLTYMYNIATIENVTPLIIPIPCYEEIFNFVIVTFFIKGRNPVVLRTFQMKLLCQDSFIVLFIS